MARPVLDIMPNLQRLTYHLTNETDTLALSSLFTHSGLQALSLECMKHSTRTTATSFRATNLVSLDLEFSFQYPHETAADFISSLPPLPHLKSITLPSWKADAATLTALGPKFPCLEEISTGEHTRNGLVGRDNYRFLRIAHSSPDLFSRGGLTSLKKMTISASYDIANSAIEDANFPITINRLRLEIYQSDMASDSGYDRLLRLLGERLSLTSITLLDERPGEESPIRAMIENRLLHSLTSLELHLNNRFNLDDELVHSLATSLPLVEKFILTQYPRGRPTTKLPDWTIVPLFARHCPLLKEFGSVFDPTTPSDMESTPLAQFRSLRKFHIGECALPRKCVSNMTVLFTLVLPPDSSIHCDEGPRADCRGWSSVVENYKTMQQVRRLQERMNAHILSSS
ncbi:hypothetical protein H0H93_010118 [Arthromyces matolae]|nr:hypothetical protein H0H93_010118 [Arthromyces matolae]